MLNRDVIKKCYHLCPFLLCFKNVFPSLLGQGMPPTSFETYPARVQIQVVGETTRLTCIAATGTRPLRYTWSKDGEIVLANSTEVSLRFRVDRSRQGNYRCLTANDYGAILGRNATLLAACKYCSVLIMRVHGSDVPVVNWLMSLLMKKGERVRIW